MVRALWTGASGMIAQQTNVDTIANNLANVNTIAYKKETVEFKSLLYHKLQTETTDYNGDPKPVISQVGSGVKLSTIASRFTQGNLQMTENPYDLAIEGDGFFAIGMNGETVYTRNGSFIVNNEDYLVTKQGEYVLDINNRRIRMIPEDWDPEIMRDRMEIIIGESGNIEMNSYTQKIPMQTIGIYDFSDKEDLFEIGDCRFVPMDKENNPELKAEKFTVQQGMLELSNASVIKEMINTIQTSRNYESLTKVVTTNNELLRTAVSVGRIGQ